MSKITLNKEQQEAVEYIDSPLLIVAGAGTGKTRVLTEKIAYLIESGKAKPEEILALTFTDKAAQEMQERVDARLTNGYMDLQISTFHGFAQRLLEHYGLDIGVPNQFKLYTQTESWLLIKQHIYDFELNYYRPLGNPARHIHSFIGHFSKCKDELISAKEYIDYATSLTEDADNQEDDYKVKTLEIAHAYQTYNKLLLDNNALDFGDLMFYSVKLLKERKNVRERVQKQYKYILVDEFQDVNYAQYEMVKYISEQSQLTVVGDDDQSIYAFRGASVSNIMRFSDEYNDAKQIVLTQNYRSGQAILDSSYTLIQQNNPDRLEAKLNINKQLSSSITDTATVEHMHYPTLDGEVEAVVGKIDDLLQTGTSADEIAILVRANAHAEPFIRGLETKGLPYEFLSAQGLYRQPIVIDVFSACKLVVTTNDSAAIYRMLRIPTAHISEEDIQKITSHAKKKSLSYFEVLKNINELHVEQNTKVFAAKLISTVAEMSKHDRIEKPTHSMYRFLESMGYLEYLTTEEQKGNAEVIGQIYQLRQFFEFIERYQTAVPDATMYHFVQYFSEILESGDEGVLYQPTDTPNSVNIMTIHASKGLEFEHVFVVNMVDDRFPSRRRGEPIEIPEQLVKEILPEGDAHYQEERRLCYVALTRAKKGLYLTSGTNYGGVRDKKPSRFLRELGFEVQQLTKKSKARIQSYTPNKHTAEFVYTLPKAFSFSQIKTYQTCPYKYKLSHILKIPSKGSASFSFGSTMHAALQKFYEAIKERNSATQVSLFNEPTAPQKSDGIDVPRLTELLEFYENCWIDDWYKSKKQKEGYYTKGKEILQAFYESHEGNWTIPVALESWFKIKVGDYFLHGRIDRVDQLEDGTLEILDYKTGKTKEKVIGEDKEQLLIYQIAATALPEYHHIGQTSKLTYYYLNDNVQASFIGSQKDIDSLMAKITKTIDGIHEGNFDPTPGKFVCSFCDFKEICEYRML